ncbi:helix-turn-helix domain-containing protein [Saccharothrix stipae]
MSTTVTSAAALREVRSWRRLSLTAVAGLAGITPAYLSMIERGLRPVTKRSVLEALANALQVAPTELTGSPFAPTDARGAEAHAAIREVETVLSAVDLGVDPGVRPASWPELRDRVIHLNTVLRPGARHRRQGRPGVGHGGVHRAAAGAQRRVRARGRRRPAAACLARRGRPGAVRPRVAHGCGPDRVNPALG